MLIGEELDGVKPTYTLFIRPFGTIPAKYENTKEMQELIK